MQNIEVTIPYSSRGNGQWHCSPDILNTNSYGIAHQIPQYPQLWQSSPHIINSNSYSIDYLTSSIPTAMALLTWHPQYPQLWHSRQERSTSRWNRTQRGWRGQDRTEPTPSHRTPSLRKYGRCRIKGFENTIEVGLKALEIPRSRI